MRERWVSFLFLFPEGVVCRQENGKKKATDVSRKKAAEIQGQPERVIFIKS